MIWRECHRMVLFFIAVCWCRINRYKPSKWTLFRILHQNRVQNIIECHNNNIWKQMCIKILCYSTETYLWYNVQREKQVEIYMWDPHHELVLFLQGRNYFCYVSENEIEGGILGWTTSTGHPGWYEHILHVIITYNNHPGKSKELLFKIWGRKISKRDYGYCIFEPVVSHEVI